MSQPGKSINDNFMAMVTAKAQVTLPLGEFQPKSTLVTAEHHLERARFPVIDYHNHLDALDPVDVLRILDACGIERIVNITMKTGDEAIAIMQKFHSADAERFATIGWMDWSGLERDDFVQVTLDRLERLVEHGAKGIKFWKDLGLSVRDREGSLLRVDDERLAPVFDKAAELGIPVMFHIADPDAFFYLLTETTSAMRNWRRTPTGVFTALIFPSESCLINVIASLPVIRRLHLSQPM